MFIQNNKVRYRYGVKFVKIELSVVKEGKVLDKKFQRSLSERLLLLVDCHGVGVDALVVALHVVTVLVCPLQPVVPLAALGAHPGGFGLSDQPSFPRPSCSRLVTGLLAFRRLRVAWSVGWSWSCYSSSWLSEASGLKSRQLQRGASTRCR